VLVKLVLVDCLTYQRLLFSRSLTGDTPHNDHLVTVRPDQLDQEETLSIRITRWALL